MCDTTSIINCGQNNGHFQQRRFDLLGNKTLPVGHTIINVKCDIDFIPKNFKQPLLSGLDNHVN